MDNKLKTVDAETLLSTPMSKTMFIVPPVSDAERPESGASTASARGNSEQAGSNFE